MMELHKQVESIIQHIRTVGRDRCQFAENLQKIATSALMDLPEFLDSQVLDDDLFSNIVPLDISGFTTGGIDGGLLTRTLAGVDIIAIRAIGVVLSYRRPGILDKTVYFPQKHPPLRLITSDEPLGLLDFENYSSIHRAAEEIIMGIQTLLKSDKKLNILFMDGSFTTRTRLATASTNNKLQQVYEVMLKRIEALHATAKRKGTLLAWVVKDSRTRHFLSFLGDFIPFVASKHPQLLENDYRQLLKLSKDQIFMFYFLPVGTRSWIMCRSKMGNNSKNEFPFDVYSFYVKPVKYDIPLRVDFLATKGESESSLKKKADQMASLVFALSAFNHDYCLPAPLIEADARVRISRQEFDVIMDSICARSSLPETFYRKRERSPL